MLTDANLIYARLCGITIAEKSETSLVARMSMIDQSKQSYIEYLNSIVDGVWPEPDDPELRDMIRRANIRKSIMHVFKN